MLSSNTQQKGGRAREKEKNRERKEERKKQALSSDFHQHQSEKGPDRYYYNINTTNPLRFSGDVVSIYV